MSYKSESSYRSDDSDSFMELDFHRPRTASDSHGYRPRASSFGKTAISALQGHRPRSSSYGQGVRTFKLNHGKKIGSYESVRTTSQELLLHKTSVDSLSHRSSRDSLRMSSSESLRKLSDELRTKTNLLNTDYIDMSLDKRKAPSPQPSRGQENGYMDMTLGSRTTSPNRSRSEHSSGNTSKSQSLEKLHLGHIDETYINIEPAEHEPVKHEPVKHVKVTTDDSYVMYAPSVGLTSHPQENNDGTHPNTDSRTKKSKHSGMLEKAKGKVGHSTSKSKSNKESKVHQKGQSSSRKEEIDEYIEFSPTESKLSGPPIIESEYVGYSPGSVLQTSSPIVKPQAVKSFITSQLKSDTSKPSRLGTAHSSLVTNSSSKTYSGLVTNSSSKTQDESEYVLSSPIGSGPHKVESTSSFDYVLSSPIGSYTPASSKGAGDAGPQTLKQNEVRKSGVGNKTPKKDSQIPMSSDGAYFNLDLGRPTKRSEEGTSVDPHPSSVCTSATKPQESTKQSQESVKQIQESVKQIQESVSTPPKQSSAERTKNRPKLKIDIVKSPSKRIESVQVKQYSGSTTTATTTTKTTTTTTSGNIVQSSAGIKCEQTHVSIDSSLLLESTATSHLNRPGSTPCLLSLDEVRTLPAPVVGPTLTVDSHPRSRHSISDLGAYEQMTFPSNTLSSTPQQQQASENSLSQQQAASGKNSSQQLTTDSQKVLNYASLDLGSSEVVGENDGSFRSPRTKSRHSSSASEKGEPPLSYAKIDFEKSESLKASAANKDVKFTL